MKKLKLHLLRLATRAKVFMARVLIQVALFPLAETTMTAVLSKLANILL
jgi:hypothetical protein